MPTLHPPHRVPLLPHARHRQSTAHANPLYGYGYNPAWPSILSVAHDEYDGTALFIILDRPCALTGMNLQLTVPADGPLAIVDVQLLLPVKLQVWFENLVPQGAAWRWSGGACDLFDPRTGCYPNAAAGTCADFPGPIIPV